MTRVSVTDTHEVKQKSEMFARGAKRALSGVESATLAREMPHKLPLQERVRQRIRQLVLDGGVGHGLLASRLGLTRSAVTRLLNDEGAGIALQHIERVCEFFQLTASELMVEPGSLIQPVTPAEASLLRSFRHLTEVQRMGLLAILDRTTQQPTTRRRARLGRAELTEEQQLLVDLYARSNEQARSGILKTLRGTARLGDGERNQRTE